MKREILDIDDGSNVIKLSFYFANQPLKTEYYSQYYVFQTATIVRSQLPLKSKQWEI